MKNRQIIPLMTAAYSLAHDAIPHRQVVGVFLFIGGTAAAIGAGSAEKRCLPSQVQRQTPSQLAVQ